MASDDFEIVESLRTATLRRFAAEAAGISPSGLASYPVVLPGRVRDPGVLYDRSGPPPWAIGFSRRFKKDLAALDRKLLGRVFLALADISEMDVPFDIKGDTFKPLTGDLRGCWRYRLGDWRLVLKPDRDEERLDVLLLAPRDSVYD